MKNQWQNIKNEKIFLMIYENSFIYRSEKYQMYYLFFNIFEVHAIKFVKKILFWNTFNVYCFSISFLKMLCP